MAASPTALLAILSLVVGVLTIASPAAAQLTISASAGGFDPWQGDGGGDFRGAVGATFGRGKNFRLSGEFSYRDLETRVYGVDNIEIESYRLSVVFHYRFMPNAVIQPYLGARGTVALNSIDDEAIERAKDNLYKVDDYGAGVGFAAVFGLEVPMNEHLFLFAEVDAGADFLITDDNDPYDRDYWDDDDNTDSEEIGGITGSGGIRIVF